ncbi:hypothetical protein FBU30_005569 [Linnemannia zychae]|nr:hypothetical protein FBU30_005569 [Linnemannia zychae]
MRSTLRKKVTIWTILVLSTSVILFARAGHDRPPQQSVFVEEEDSEHASEVLRFKYKRDEHLVENLPWQDGQEPIQSYAGHFPIRSWHQAGYRGETSMFYWFFPAIKPKSDNPPLLFWFQGGPGSSSMIGQFFGNGPIYLTENNTLARRETHWAQEYSIVFIDQPVGTGYSYVTRLQDNTSEEEPGPNVGVPRPPKDDPITDENSGSQDIDDKILVELDNELLRDQSEEEEIFAELVDQDMTIKLEQLQQRKIGRKAPAYSKGYVKDQRGVAADLLTFMDQFYYRYPEMKKSDLYLTGESYAGKYVPALAYAILESNQGYRHRYRFNDDDDSVGYEKFIFPLKGIALGNSLTDPIRQVRVHSDYAYFLGLANKLQADNMKFLQDQAVKEAHMGRFMGANQFRVALFDYFKLISGGLNWYDIRKGDIPNDWSKMEEFLNQPEIKDALNVFGPRQSYLDKIGVTKEEVQRITDGRAKTKFGKDPLVIKTMEGDIMKSTAWMVSELLRQGIRVVAYQGIFDFRDAVAGSESWLNNLEWDGARNFTNAERKVWIEDGHLAGYVTQVPGLTEVVVYGASHLAPMDKPNNVYTIIRSLVENVPLGTLKPNATVTTHSI